MLGYLRYLQWLVTYLPGFDPEALLDDPNDTCMAVMNARRLASKQAKSGRLIQSHPHGQQFLATQAKLFSSSGLSVGQAADAGLGTSFALVLAAAKKHIPVPPGVGVDHVHSVFLDYDESYALTKTYADGSALIRVTNAIITSCQLLAAVNTVVSRHDRWTRRGARRPEVIYPAAAALRYYLIHQRAWGTSGKVMPTTTARKVLSGLDTLAILFLFAHELGHHWLQHGIGDPAAHQLELEADRFAHQLLSAIVDDDRSGLADASAAIALLGIELDQKGRFIRGPETHPSLRTRVGNIQGRAEPELGPWLSRFLPDLVSSACRRDSLPDEFWPALSASREWNTSVHPEDYLQVVQSLDATSSLNFDEGRRFVATLTGIENGAITEGLSHLESGDAARACTLWQVDPVELLEDRTPLSFFTVVEMLTESAAVLDAVDGDSDKAVVTAFLCTHRLLPFLAPYQS